MLDMASTLETHRAYKVILNDTLLLIVLGVTFAVLPVQLVFMALEPWSLIATDLVTGGFIVIWHLRLNHFDQTRYLPEQAISLTWVVLAALPVYSVAATFKDYSSWTAWFLINHLGLVPYLLHRLYLHLENTFLSKGFRVFLIAGGSLIALHWVASLWAWLHLDARDFLSQYVESLYWAVTTITTVGYGDIVPGSNLTRLLTIAMMLLGVVFYGVVIGEVSRNMLATDKRKAFEREKLEALKSFLQHYDIPPLLRQEAFRFYRYKLQHLEADAERTILSELPSDLEEQLRTFVYIKPLSEVALFNGCPLECLQQAAKKLSHHYASPGERIMSRGDHSTEMYLIGHGTVRVHRGEQKITELHNNQCFGETALIRDEKRTADVTAVTYCDLYRLSRADFEELVEKFPVIQINIRKIMANHV